MRTRMPKILRRFLVASALAVAVIGSISYFSYLDVARRLTPMASDGRVVWGGFGSGYGRLWFSYCTFPKALDVQGPGFPLNPVLAGRGTVIWRSWNRPQWNWPWFSLIHEIRQGRLTGAATKSLVGAPVITYPVHLTAIDIPYWFLFLIAVPYPLYSLLDIATQRRRKRLAAGQCVACGYDLRHTPDRCPECGLVPTDIPPISRRIQFVHSLIAFAADKWCQILPYAAAITILGGTAYLSYSRYYRR